MPLADNPLGGVIGDHCANWPPSFVMAFLSQQHRHPYEVGYCQTPCESIFHQHRQASRGHVRDGRQG